jgi:multicomponent Na+:H+ antiporter subunit E
MPLLMLNLFFAAVFTLLLGSTSIGVFLVGFVLGYGILWVSSPLYPDTRYFTKLPKTLNLTVFFLKELVISSLRASRHKQYPPQQHDASDNFMASESEPDLSEGKSHD